MNRYKLLSRALSAASLATGIIAAKYAKTVIESHQIDGAAEFAIMFSIFAILLVYLKVFLGHVVATMPILRRILLGKQYVDGKWINRLITKDGKEYFGIITIEPDGETLTYGGENYLRNGAPYGEFDSRSIEISFPVITFKYGPSPSMNSDFSEGIVRVTFHERPPVRFSAVCIDYYKEDPYQIEAWKISDRRMLKRIRSSNERIDAVKELIEGLFPINDKLQAKPSNKLLKTERQKKAPV